MNRNEKIAGTFAGCGCVAGFAAIGLLVGVLMYRMDGRDPPAEVTDDRPIDRTPPVEDAGVSDAGPGTEILAPRPVSDRFTVGQRFSGQMDCEGQEPSSLELRVVLASDRWAVVHLNVVEYPRTVTGERTARRLEHRLEGPIEGRTMTVRYTQTVRGTFPGPAYEVVATLDATGRVLTGSTTRTGCRAIAATLL